MAWTTPGTATAGSVLTAAYWNTQVRDNMNVLAPVAAGWTVYTPTLTASVTNPTLGTGSTATGRYLQMGKLVVGVFEVSFGTSGTNAGSGNYIISLPVQSNTLGAATMGSGWMLQNAGATRRLINLRSNTSTTIFLQYDTATGTVTNALPWAWTTSDSIRGQLIYEAA